MHYVLCLRSVADVARSLERRDGFSTARARLWLLHVASAFAHTAGRPRLLLFYEDLMADWREHPRRLAAFLGVPERVADPAVQRAVQAAIDQELYHHRITLPVAAADPALPFPAKAVSLVLRAGIRPAAGGAEGEEPGLQAALDVFVRAAMAADEHERRLVESRETLEAELGAAREGLAAREAELGAARERLAGLEAEIATLTSGLAWGIVSAYRRGVETTLPPGSRRRRAYSATVGGVRALLRGLWSLVSGTGRSPSKRGHGGGAGRPGGDAQ